MAFGIKSDWMDFKRPEYPEDFLPSPKTLEKTKPEAVGFRAKNKPTWVTGYAISPSDAQETSKSDPSAQKIFTETFSTDSREAISKAESDKQARFKRLAKQLKEITVRNAMDLHDGPLPCCFEDNRTNKHRPASHTRSYGAEPRDNPHYVAAKNNVSKGWLESLWDSFISSLRWLFQ